MLSIRKRVRVIVRDRINVLVCVLLPCTDSMIKAALIKENI